MSGRVEIVNPGILKECRHQVSIPLEEIQKKVAKISQIENGEIHPTFHQLSLLSEQYNVPRWVFIKDHLPEKYRFDRNVPGFRMVKNSAVSADPHTSSHVKKIMAKVEGLRELILDLSESIDQQIPYFEPPILGSGSEQKNPENSAAQVRNWCGMSDAGDYACADTGAVSDAAGMLFHEWKELLEKKGIFVFLTSKYPGWSHIDRSLFRGLAIYHDLLPIIIINDSDAKKAQSFTLFHELGHLIRKESSVDSWEEHSEEEKWCDHFAGAALMPSHLLQKCILSNPVTDFGSLKKQAAALRVSPYAYLVRQIQLKLISQHDYNALHEEIQEEWKKIQNKLKEHDGGPPRNRVQEILNQYGYYSRTFFQAYHENEINLHRLMKLLEFKKTSYVKEALEIL